jgi:hypothetical protein
MNEQPSLFLSYASADQQFATRLAMDLQASGAQVWIDQAEMRLGDFVVDRLRKAIEQTDYFAVILSPAALTSDWVKKEIEIAMWRESDTAQNTFLPLLYQKCELPWFLKDRVYADFTVMNSYEDCIARILQHLGLVSRSNFIVYDLGGGTIDSSVIRIKNEYRGKVDIESLARDVKDLGIKYEQEIRDQNKDERKKG